MSDSRLRALLSRVTRLEVLVGAAVGAIMVLLVVLEPDILEAPFENGRTVLFTVGGTALAAVAFVAMLWLRVPAPARLVVLGAPFVAVNWWLLSPYFIDDVVDDEFSTSISEQLAIPEGTGGGGQAPASTSTPPIPEETPVPDEAPAPVAERPVPSAEPVLLGAGQFVGLAGHDGTGDAGIFRNPDGSLVLRFENFDIENGPDLEVYLVPGADQTSLADGALHLGALRGNIGDQTYELPPGTDLAPGPYTALVWCEAFSVEFVGATVSV